MPTILSILQGIAEIHADYKIPVLALTASHAAVYGIMVFAALRRALPP